ncbi:cytochrome P450 [Haliangium ochraceum]|uniref:Cytochrome P450 n=1 Tax=Haliangium ochraceum (strain DSM 14365 / JCM 11303 / SMP-2) TaxID=502025 RepID=D0LP65_HALO1|nr:cytochrome P450 [Haliangium ochraceum]ACY13430.1 cytochrome P450 [Haliangium ochraceum DSM 14365]
MKHAHPPRLSPFEHTRQLLASPFQWLVDSQTRTGDIARLGIGHQSVLLSSHPEHADHVFRRHARRYARAGRFWDALPGIFGRGLLMTADETWLRHRRLLQRFFRRDHLLSIAEPLLATIEDAVARHLGTVRGPRVLDVHPVLEAIVLECMITLVFGTRLSDADRAQVRSQITWLTRRVPQALLYSTLPASLARVVRNRYAENLLAFRRRIAAMAADCRREPSVSDDMLSELVWAASPGGAVLPDAEIEDEIINVFIAGLDTSVLGVTWAVALTATHPAEGEGISSEGRALGAHRRLRPEHIDALTRSLWVFQEGLRLYPPIWFSPRLALADDEFGGCELAAGSTVIRMTHVLHRHPQFWAESERFLPERFEPGRCPARHRAAWVPYGLGPHVCIGRHLAAILSQAIITILFARYRLELSGRMPRPLLRASLAPQGGVPVRISPI